MTQTIEFVAPAQLHTETNVRRQAGLTEAFVSNIKANGVLVPIVAHRTEDGTLRVLYGQRRTLAAVEAGLEAVPVYITSTPEEADRLATQVAENDQRQALTEADRAEAFHQMALLGISAAQIAKRAGTDRGSVEKALKARTSESASAALGAGYTIDQSLLLAEFEDSAEATQRLEAAIADDPDMLEHVAQRLRDERERARQLAAAAAEYEAQGLTVVEQMGWCSTDEAVALRFLTDAEGSRPGEDDANAVSLYQHWQGEVRAELGIVGWAEKGYTAREPNRSTERQSGPMTEEQKAQRKVLIANNKAMESATKVRRTWVTGLLARKNAPKDWAGFLALAHTQHHRLAGERDTTLAAAFAGCANKDNDWNGTAISDYAAAHPAKPHVPLLALAFAGFEKNMPKDCWRTPTEDIRFYLNQLTAWGYKPSDVERIITADELD
ncbi:ParB/RepB/Spo0J family partition protein [Sinomonas mesophila]|uniref:ParB/RepB/Spo0J family partition protein n=1 Tax=Sinomonas mesophila TaxID=1531955 RepID=UPI000985A3B5|nr:ParB N-terminal domain-containing protein [Sinomonas mesophila]